jgi:hypothetical protein
MLTSEEDFITRSEAQSGEKRKKDGIRKFEIEGVAEERVWTPEQTHTAKLDAW